MPIALVTGASSGLGAEFARQLASSAYDVVLVARDEGRLTALALELDERYGATCEVLVADLSKARGRASVERRLRRSTEPVALLVNNAGFGVAGTFLDSQVADEEAMLAVNVHAVMRLTRAAAEVMVERGHGDIINVASVAAFLPNDNGATYAASKAYVTAMTESLAMSVKGTGVHVSVVCPGFVHTEFHRRLDVDTAWIPRFLWLDAPDVVRSALAGHRAGKVRVVPSVTYKAVVAATRLIPAGVLRNVVARGRKVAEAR